MIIVKSYHNSRQYEILEKGTRLELLSKLVKIIKSHDVGEFLKIEEEFTDGYCYADFAHVKNGANEGFVIALAEDIITDIKKISNYTKGSED